jgi:MFS family permease
VAASPRVVYGEEGEAPAGEQRRALALMVTSHAVQHFYVGGLALVYPVAITAFHVSYGLLGAVLTAAGLLGGLLQGAAGLIRRTSARVVLGAQNVGLAAASVLGAVAPGFAVFGAARCLGAGVSWPQHPVGSAYLAQRFPRRRGSVLSWHTAGGSIGTVLVPLVASAVIATAGWRWALVAIAIPMGLGGVLVWSKLPADRTTAPGEPSAAEGGSRLEARARAEHDSTPGQSRLWQLLRRRPVALVLAASTVAAGGRGLGTISTYAPAYLKSGLHLGQFSIGAVFTVIMAASVVGPVIAGYVGDRIGRVRVLVLAYVAGAASLVGFVFVGRSLVALMATGIAVGVLAYAESPLLQAVFADAAGADGGRAAFGAFFAIAYGVGALWLALLGWVIDAFGFRAAFVVMAGSFVGAAALVASAARPLAKERGSGRV